MNLKRIFCYLVFLFIIVNCYGQGQNKDVKIKKFDVPVESVCWSPDGTFYITTNGNRLLFWDSATDEMIMEKSEHDASILTVDISDDGLSVVIVYNDNTFLVEGIENEQYHIHQKGISTIPILDTVFFDNYTLLVPLDGQHVYTVYSLLATNGSLANPYMISDKSYIYGMDLSSDKKKLLITAFDGTIALFDTDTKEKLMGLEGYNPVSISAKFNRTGDHFLYLSDEYTINIKSVDGANNLVIKNYDKPINAADFSPNGKSVAVSDMRGFVKIYDVELGFVEDALKLDEGDYACSCEFDPTGECLIIGTSLGQVIKWKPQYQRPGMYGGGEGSGTGTGTGEGTGSGDSSGNGEGDGKGSNDDKPVFVLDSQDKIEGQANIFNTANAKKVVDLATHNIYFGFGVGSINSKKFIGNIKAKVGYHNFQFYPFYWGGEIGADLGLASKNLPYRYKVNGKVVPPPSLLGFAPTAKGGFHYLFDKVGILAFAELGVGANIRMLTTGGFVGKPTVSFFTGIGIGAQWKVLRAEFDVQIDTNFIYSLNGTIGCSFRLASHKKSKGAKR